MDIDPPYINYLLGSGDWYITLLKLWFGLGLGFLLSLGWFWGCRWVFMMSLQMLIFGRGRGVGGWGMGMGNVASIARSGNNCGKTANCDKIVIFGRFGLKS